MADIKHISLLSPINVVLHLYPKAQKTPNGVGTTIVDVHIVTNLSPPNQQSIHHYIELDGELESSIHCLPAIVAETIGGIVFPKVFPKLVDCAGHAPFPTNTLTPHA